MAGSNVIKIKKSKDNKKYIVVQGVNNKVIVNSETYNSNAAVDKAVSALRKVVKNATVVDTTITKKKAVKK